MTAKEILDMAKRELPEDLYISRSRVLSGTRNNL